MRRGRFALLRLREIDLLAMPLAAIVGFFAYGYAARLWRALDRRGPQEDLLFGALFLGLALVGVAAGLRVGFGRQRARVTGAHSVAMLWTIGIEVMASLGVWAETILEGDRTPTWSAALDAGPGAAIAFLLATALVVRALLVVLYGPILADDAASPRPLLPFQRIYSAGDTPRAIAWTALVGVPAVVVATRAWGGSLPFALVNAGLVATFLAAATARREARFTRVERER